MTFADVLNGLQIAVPSYSNAQKEEDEYQLRVLIAAAALQRDAARSLTVHTWLAPASPELTGLPAGVCEQLQHVSDEGFGVIALPGPGLPATLAEELTGVR